VTRNAYRPPAPRPPREPPQQPVGERVFWISIGLSGLCCAVIVWLVLANVPGDVFSFWPRVFIVALLAIFVCGSLATTEVIPWGSRSWIQWRRPKVLGAVVCLLLGAGGFVAGVATIFNPPAAEQKTLVATQKAVQGVDRKLDELSTFLHARFPDDPPVLKEIGGRWGDLDPACEVVWDIRVVRRGGKAALVAETTRVPDGAKPHRFVGDIINVEDGVLYVEGVEPQTAQGALAHFTLNAASQRLSWDDRSRGSGGVETYRRCA